MTIKVHLHLHMPVPCQHDGILNGSLSLPVPRPYYHRSAMFQVQPAGFPHHYLMLSFFVIMNNSSFFEEYSP